MGPNTDRIRRILSDAKGAVRRASDPPIAPPASPGGVNPVDPGRERLLERLRALRAGARPPPRSGESGAERLLGGDSPVLSLPEEDGRTLEERIGGTLRGGPKGSFHEVLTRYPLDATHGNVPLRDLIARPIPLRARERRKGGVTHLRPEDVAYLDIETTGLAGGTGTIAFLVGVGRIEGDAFVVRQYFIRDFPDEPAALEALAFDLGDSPLVTFNGRSFDWPLLATRFRIHRIPVAERDHVDLLPVARRLWAGSLASHALSHLERHVLGVLRTEDLPGALVPAAYFAWLREARSAGVALAFRHNEVDVVSMAALGAVASRLIDAPDDDADDAADDDAERHVDDGPRAESDAGPVGRSPRARAIIHPGDALGRAMLLLQQGHDVRARALLETAARGRIEEVPRRLLVELGRLLRRAGDDDAALALWGRRLAASLPFDPVPAEEIAKILEHRRHDPRAASNVVEKALGACPSHDARRPQLAHRAERLRRKSSRMPPP